MTNLILLAFIITIAITAFYVKLYFKHSNQVALRVYEELDAKLVKVEKSIVTNQQGLLETIEELKSLNLEFKKLKHYIALESQINDEHIEKLQTKLSEVTVVLENMSNNS